MHHSDTRKPRPHRRCFHKFAMITLASSTLALATLTSTAHGISLVGAECPVSGDGTSLQLRVENVRTLRGSVTISIYGDRPEDFLVKGKKLAKIRLPVQAGTVRACLSLPEPGTYALAAYHDEDGDGRLTRNLLGVPVEGFGFSNNPTVVLAPPAFDAVAITVGATPTPVNLRLQYP